MLARPVFAGDAERRFGELSVEEVEAGPPSFAARPGSATAAGSAPSRPPGASWRPLMRANDAATVADLDGGEVAARAEALWVLPPGGSLLP